MKPVGYMTVCQKVLSRARVAAGAFGFLIFSYVLDGSDLYGASSFFETNGSKFRQGLSRHRQVWHHRVMTAMRYLMVLFALIPTRALAQELSAEDRACINAAIDKLPRLDGLRVEGSRITMSQPARQERNKQYPYHAMVEIDVSLGRGKTTHSFFCHGDTITMKALPVEMR